ADFSSPRAASSSCFVSGTSSRFWARSRSALRCASSSWKNSRWKSFHGRRGTTSSYTAQMLLKASSTARPTNGHFRLCCPMGLLGMSDVQDVRDDEDVFDVEAE